MRCRYEERSFPDRNHDQWICGIRAAGPTAMTSSAVPRAAFANLFANNSPRVLTVHCSRSGESGTVSEPAPYIPE
jgi:hypothetical protein